jgi:hypothetical protein
MGVTRLNKYVTTHGVNGLVWPAPVLVTACRVPEIVTSSLVERMRLYVSQADRVGKRRLRRDLVACEQLHKYNVYEKLGGKRKAGP